MMNPLVTVITSTFNWPGALREAMKTVFAQELSDFEYLVVGDCCTDETEDVIKEFDDPRLRWFNLDSNTGNQSGVNKIAMNEARGEYISYLNHDDLWFPDHLSTLMDAIESNSLDIVNSTCLEVAACNHPYRGVQGLPYQDSTGNLYILPVTTTVVHRKDAGLEAGGWIDWRESTNVPTTDFFVRVIRLRKKFAIVPKCTAIKFNSADRKDSYKAKDATEQKEWREKILEDPNLREKELLTAYACLTMGEQPPRLRLPRPRGEKPNGWEIEHYRRIRGLSPMLDIGDTEKAEIDTSMIRPSRFRIADNKPPLIMCEDIFRRFDK